MRPILKKTYQKENLWPQDISVAEFTGMSLQLMDIVGGYEPLIYNAKHTGVLINGFLQPIERLKETAQSEKTRQMYHFQGLTHICTESLMCSLQTRTNPKEKRTRIYTYCSGIIFLGGVGAATTEIYPNPSIAIMTGGIAGLIYSLYKRKREETKYIELTVFKKHNNNLRKLEELRQSLETLVI